MRILVLNSGSSSIKFRLFDLDVGRTEAAGLVERIGEDQGRARIELAGDDTPSDEQREEALVIPDHAAGFRWVQEHLVDAGLGAAGDLDGIGHRVVHGGEAFQAPALIDESVLATIRAHIPLAPLHNPANLTGIEAAQRAFPTTPQVAVFDTAFHQSMPPRAYRYAIPDSLYEEYGVRRYGFHGTSHRYVTGRVARYLGVDHAQLNLVILHLGNGASATAVKGGRSVDTSMGLTPLEGLMMGTRSGDLDPALHAFLARNAGLDIDRIDAMLNRDSGLKGICGSGDMREVEARAGAGDEAALLALDMYCYRIRKYLGAYAAVLGRVDAVAFTAGIGENSPTVRAGATQGLEPLGLVIDSARNRDPQGDPAEIQAQDSRVKVLVVATNEELQIAEETAACLAGPDPGNVSRTPAPAGPPR